MFGYVALTTMAFAWRTYAQSSSESPSTFSPSSESPSGAFPTSTVYFAPVTITNPASCTKTSFAYIAMESVTEHEDVAATMTPWTITSFTTTPDIANPTPFIQVDVFLTQQPFSISPNPEELAFQKACYDPRATICPSSSPISGPPHVGCMSAFPGGQVANPPPPVPSQGAGAGSVQSSQVVTLSGALIAGSLAFLFGL
ncbi:hypothetical protein EJ05DRAFT_482236 [Pseudovirgaria hyperparasitica]|uniref:Uncharacterized protein n=1 Tax=Pseudovirgaria hyperparasitica TaxID=470096 RepID=A0A6A6WMJ3_9PEZI|nr:uncharacterized protein EJ05DRAFT_482236 [Pseudovirgaria hyperparasitica]KAF2763431.1 hypothetical protein EJ05DRAFT_482236 [Pseudovirgaria hyperparasitica]